jgi:hypothetical protein
MESYLNIPVNIEGGRFYDNFSKTSMPSKNENSLLVGIVSGRD